MLSFWWCLVHKAVRGYSTPSFQGCLHKEIFWRLSGRQDNPNCFDCKNFDKRPCRLDCNCLIVVFPLCVIVCFSVSGEERKDLFHWAWRATNDAESVWLDSFYTHTFGYWNWIKPFSCPVLKCFWWIVRPACRIQWNKIWLSAKTTITINMRDCVVIRKVI